MSIHGIPICMSALTQGALSQDGHGAAARRLTSTRKVDTMRLTIPVKSTIPSLSVATVTVTQSASKPWIPIVGTEALKRAEVGPLVLLMVIENTGGIGFIAGRQMRKVVRMVANLSVGFGTVRQAGLHGVTWMVSSRMEKGADDIGILHSPPTILMAKSADTGVGSK